MASSRATEGIGTTPPGRPLKDRRRSRLASSSKQQLFSGGERGVETWSEEENSALVEYILLFGTDQEIGSSTALLLPHLNTPKVL